MGLTHSKGPSRAKKVKKYTQKLPGLDAPSPGSWCDLEIRSGPELGPGAPTRPADSGTFARNAKSGFELTYFQAIPGNAMNNLQNKNPEWGPEKFRNLQAWLGLWAKF